MITIEERYLRSEKEFAGADPKKVVEAIDWSIKAIERDMVDRMDYKTTLPMKDLIEELTDCLIARKMWSLK